jgi:hypothetical protein
MQLHRAARGGAVAVVEQVAGRLVKRVCAARTQNRIKAAKVDLITIEHVCAVSACKCLVTSGSSEGRTLGRKQRVDCTPLERLGRQHFRTYYCGKRWR